MKVLFEGNHYRIKENDDILEEGVSNTITDGIEKEIFLDEMVNSKNLVMGVRVKGRDIVLRNFITKKELIRGGKEVRFDNIYILTSAVKEIFYEELGRSLIQYSIAYRDDVFFVGSFEITGELDFTY